MPSAFSITTPSVEVTLDRQHSPAASSFTVTNVSGRALSAAARAVADPPAEVSWFSVQGQATRALDPGESDIFVVGIAVPRLAPGGVYGFRLDVRDAGDPNLQDTGPEIAVTVPAPITAPPTGYVATLVGALGGDVLLAAAAAIGFAGWIGYGQGVMILLGGVAGAYVGLRSRGHDRPGLTAAVLAGIQLVWEILALLLLLWIGSSPWTFLALIVLLAVPPLPARGFVLWRAGRFVWPWSPLRPAVAS